MNDDIFQKCVDECHHLLKWNPLLECNINALVKEAINRCNAPQEMHEAICNMIEAQLDYKNGLIDQQYYIPFKDEKMNQDLKYIIP
jgi:hypothetical protein